METNKEDPKTKLNLSKIRLSEATDQCENYKLDFMYPDE